MNGEGNPEHKLTLIEVKEILRVLERLRDRAA